ncbi:carboxylating nicotinate-nucleotide diphosphorylase [Jonesia quinghaiensis]|uniref:carboxylating nicotinate-nucleotide diphosphorylase n=1 Tax=Jonesia quinghaiensis TaxID=262806 RepID=UPI0004051E02|nr:carboxylating nicotinate-nucleotide diphosphorylase [Jonesia quinghaiensis]
MTVTVTGSPALPGDRGLNDAWMQSIVDIALAEDLGEQPGRDVTTMATMPATAQIQARLVAREEGVVAGLALVPVVLTQVVDRLDLGAVQVDFHATDGETVTAGQQLAVLTGPVWALLIAERTLLNLVSRASGVATATHQWALALEGTSSMVLDTRKTTPGLRELEKYAVRAGGGTNKRMGLFDVAMVKDNHIAAAGSVTAAVHRVRDTFPDVDIQVEADTEQQAVEAVQAGARFLLLDNMANDVMAGVVRRIRALEPEFGRVELEATGNLTIERARSVAETGVDYMSVGALTHSARILDLALDMG